MAEHIEELTKMLETGACIGCRNGEKGVGGLRRTQTENNPMKEEDELN